MLNDQQKKFLEISKKREFLKEQLKTVSEELEGLMSEMGVGTHFQDPEDKTVFEIVVPKGKFIPYVNIGYNRTRREGERSGELSLKRAKELGYTL